MKSIVKSKLISLRTLLLDDLDFIFELENDSTFWYAADIHETYSKDDLKNFITHSVDIFQDNQQRFIVVSNETNETVGMLDLFNFNSKHMYASVGIIIHPNHQKKGFAKDAINACKLLASEEIGLRNLTASVAANNLVSIQLFENSGFIKIGTRKNWFYINGKKNDEFIYQYQLT